MKWVCVFCGSKCGERAVYADVTRELARELVQRNLGLVFGAGHIGLMGVLADAVLLAGGQAVGVIPRAMVDKELAHTRLTELVVVETMHQRKALMADRSDAFIALPGGFGTCDEFFEILTWRQLRIHQKPIGLLNVEGFFDPLLAWMDRAIDEAFIKPKHRALVVVETQPARMLDALAAVRPTPTEPKWVMPADR